MTTIDKNRRIIVMRTGKSIIETAQTYLDNNDKLIYSYHGNVFLQGGELFDPENGGRGRIDCSTLVHLALQCIPYEKSPYATGDASGFFNTTCTWYRDVRGTCIMKDVFAKRSDRSADIRRAYGLARFCRETGLEIGPDETLKPGDLVFFEAGASVIEEYRKYGAWKAISHVGIVAEDAEYMIEATGSSDHKRNASMLPVRYTKISAKCTPLLTACMQQLLQNNLLQ